MKVEVSLTYATAPAAEEIELIQEAGSRLTSNAKSVTVEGFPQDGQHIVRLTFKMRTQAQYKVVDGISDEVQRWLMGPLQDIAIRFL
ncbi:MAG: hypothetical protein ACFCVD_25135 [Nodosilinea sp.]